MNARTRALVRNMSAEAAGSCFSLRSKSAHFDIQFFVHWHELSAKSGWSRRPKPRPQVANYPECRNTTVTGYARNYYFCMSMRRRFYD